MTVKDEDAMLNNERHKYGYSHSEVGALVAERWELHDQICQSIFDHHKPTLSSKPSLIAHIIDAADLVANNKGYGIREEKTEKFEFSKSLEKLRLDEEAVEKLWETTEGKIAEVIKTFG